MKRNLIPALATTLILGMTSTTFAAANPFSDVPAGHWAYDSVTKLANEGIIEGYGDGTYRGNRNITRYEMAQMVARALARVPKGNTTTTISGTSRAELDKLAAEFRDELDSLGVRVAELERNADFVKWEGKIEYTYTRSKTDPGNTGTKEKETGNGYVFQLNPSAEVNDHWTANARIEAEGDLKTDETFDATLTRVWAEGDYDKFNVKLGKMELFTNEDGLIWDTEFSGAALTFGSKWKITGMGGRIAADGVGGGILGEFDTEDDPSNFVGVNLQYENDAGLFGGAAWYQVKDDDFKTVNYSNGGDTDKANIWSANLGYAFNDNFSISGAYAQNTKADTEKYSWQASLNFGNYDDNPEKGDWSFGAGYRRYGTNVSFAPTAEDVIEGTKGWFLNAAYAPFKNVGLGAKYFKGKYITDGGDADNIWGRVEFFF
ncbi:MAG: S-layer homology domain-containing protein [Selenomonadaceae bacterium]|nr:S-layer homology domain-containing protein [Selenomonadaceae bacterium]